VRHGSTNMTRPFVRSCTLHFRKSLVEIVRQSGEMMQAAWTMRTSLLRSGKGSRRQSATVHFAEPLNCASSRGDRSTPSSRVKPSRCRATNPFPRPQRVRQFQRRAAIEERPAGVRRLTNFRISSSGDSKRRYAVSQGFRDSWSCVCGLFRFWRFCCDGGIFDGRKRESTKVPIDRRSIQGKGQGAGQGTRPAGKG